jgi:glycosyltransferase involved in cell wall biosynthesis
MSHKIILLQTCLPDYRLPLFARLMTTRTDIHLLCGQEYFTDSLALCKEPAPWRTFVRNSFILGRGLLWQSGAWDRAIAADVLIAEFNPRILSTWLLLFRRKLAGKPTIFWGHLWGQHGPQWLVGQLRLFMLQMGDGMICYTRSQAEELSRLVPGHMIWAAGNSCVTREQCAVAEAPTVGACVAYVGRLIKGKKAAILLEAFAKALTRLPPDAKLLLVGDGTEWLPLKARVKELGLANRVEMPGHVGGEVELRKIYARTLVAASPGYVGLSAIQAMAFGVPMLVSRSEPHSPEIEACIEGRTSVYFETDNVDDLADKIATFYASASPWRNKRAELSRFIADNYTFDGMVETFLSATAAVDPTVVTGAQILSGEMQVRAALVWAQYGPYHLARLRALEQRMGLGVVIGAEIANVTTTYAWTRQDSGGVAIFLPGQAAETVSATAVYESAVEFFRRQAVTVVFAPSYWPASSLAVILAARSVGARVVMMNESHQHTAKARGIFAEVKRRLILQADAALVGGSPHREYFIDMGMPAEKIALGYDAVDNGFFAARAGAIRGVEERGRIRAKHGLPERYFLNVGRMIWKKNLESLIDAYKLAKDRIGADCPALVFVGSGRLERALRDQCVELGLSVYQTTPQAANARLGAADVYFLGFRQAEELPEFYALADCFVLPSREEEWGLVVNEAMACGLPVLVSQVAGCARDLVRPGENGFQFSPFDTVTLAGHLESIARQPELVQRMGEESQRIIAAWGCERFAEGAQQAIGIATRDQQLGGKQI